MECPICEYPNTVPRYRMRDRFFGATEDEFVLHHCSSCELLFLREAEVVERLTDFYPDGYWWQEQGRLGGWERRYREWMVRHDQLGFLKKCVSAQAGQRLLDIGCGSATFVRMALEDGFEAFGHEPGEEARRIAELEVPGRVSDLSEQDRAEAGEKYDVITLFHTLEHIPSPFRYLKTVRKLLKPGGRLIVQVPNSESLQAAIFRDRWYGLDCPRHLYNYSTFSVLHLLGRAGYSIRGLEYFSLRDNAAALVSSGLPFLDPMSQRVRRLKRRGGSSAGGGSLRSLLYFGLLVAAQPLAWVEARLGRGATVKICASMDN